MHTEITITPLGAGSEVGRSCILLSHKYHIMLDCGIHPAYTGISALPFLDTIDLSQIEAVFITHFHLDHAGGLPYLTEKTNFRGKVYMTHPTKAILKWLLNDYVRIINASSDNDFYSELDLANCYEKIIAVDYHQEIVVKNMRIRALNAGHVLGAAMFLIEIGGSKILYTGDYSREEDRHLKAAEFPGKVNVLIAESTYGIQCHLPRVEREERFTKTVSNIVLRGGRCLLPVFALGRAQELLLILEEHWEKNKNLRRYPIYYASILAKKCISVYQTYLNMMNDRIKKIAMTKNPFIFRYIQNLHGIEFEDNGPCVMMASPGMLQSGFSKQLFDRWCEDPKNGTIITGYSVNGTVAKEILSEPKEIEGKKLNMTVEYISFSAHVDFIQNSEFIESCNPSHLFLVHGEHNEMQRLKNALNSKLSQIKIHTLKNVEKMKIELEHQASAISIGEPKNKFLILKDEDTKIFSIENINLTEFSNINFEQSCVIFHCSTVENVYMVLYDFFGVDLKICDFDLLSENIIDFTGKGDDKIESIMVKKPLNDKIDSNINNIVEHKIDNTNLTEPNIDRKSSEEKSIPNELSNNDNMMMVNLFDIKIVIKNNKIICKWQSDYKKDIIIYTIKRLINEIEIPVIKIKKENKKNKLIKILNKYFNIRDKDNKIFIDDDLNSIEILENGDIKVSGQTDYVDKICEIVRSVGL